MAISIRRRSRAAIVSLAIVGDFVVIPAGSASRDEVASEKVCRGSAGRREAPRARLTDRLPAVSGGPPGIRTPNLRIKSLVPRCWSERCTASDLRVCVSVLPIVSQRFPFLHGDETGRRPQLPLSFPMKATSERGQKSPRWPLPPKRPRHSLWSGSDITSPSSATESILAG